MKLYAGGFHYYYYYYFPIRKYNEFFFFLHATLISAKIIIDQFILSITLINAFYYLVEN